MGTEKMGSFRSVVSRLVASLSSLWSGVDDPFLKAQAHRRAVELRHGFRQSSGIGGFWLVLAVSIASFSAVVIAFGVVFPIIFEPDPCIDALERFRQAID